MRPIRLLTTALLTTAFALAACTGAKDAELARGLPDPDVWVLAELSSWQREGQTMRYSTLAELLDGCESAAADLSDEITRLHFSHADRRTQSVGV